MHICCRFGNLTFAAIQVRSLNTTAVPTRQLGDVGGDASGSDSFHLDHAKSGVRVYVNDQDEAIRPPGERPKLGYDLRDHRDAAFNLDRHLGWTVAETSSQRGDVLGSISRHRRFLDLYLAPLRSSSGAFDLGPELFSCYEPQARELASRAWGPRQASGYTTKTLCPAMLKACAPRRLHRDRGLTLRAVANSGLRLSARTAGLQLRQEFPNSHVKLRDVGEDAAH